MFFNQQQTTSFRNYLSKYKNTVINGTHSLTSVNNGSLISPGNSLLPDNDTDNQTINQHLSHTSKMNSGNVIIGRHTLYNNTDGVGNTAVGWHSTYSNTIGCGNSSLGWFSLYSNISGDSNVSFGVSSLFYNINGSKNTSIGTKSLLNNNGSENTSLGNNTGLLNITGNNNTYIGNEADQQTSDDNNTMNFGNSSINLLRCSSYSFSTNADQRDKKEIIPLVYGMDLISLLKPISFKWNKRDGGKVDISSCGLLAQDLKEILSPEDNDILNLLNEKDLNNLEIIYGNFIPVILNALITCNQRILALQEEINILKGT